MTHNMDIHTLKGQKTLLQEKEAIEIYQANRPEFMFVHTDKDSPSAIDGMLIDKMCNLKAIVEIKCRDNVTREEFRKNFNDEWLVTYEKIAKGIELARQIQTPFVGFLYLVKEKILIVTTIWSPKTGISHMTIERTATQKTVNGGLIYRDNAYIKLSACKEYHSNTLTT